MEYSGNKIKRKEWIDILKGIGIILVAIGHIYSNQIVYNWLYSFHMPLFFLAAGWVYKEKTILTDIKRRIQTIVVPYFSFGFLTIIYYQILERRFRDSNISFLDSVLGLLSGSCINLGFNIHLWFLPCFFLTVILFNMIVNWVGRKTAYVVVALMSLIYIIFPMPEWFWGFNRVFKYIGFYAVGVSLARMDKVKDKSLEAGTVAFILLGVNFYLSYINQTTGVMWFATALIGVAALVLISQLINTNKVLQYCGRISLVILCIHGPVYRIVVKTVSILIHMDTNAVRERTLFAMIVVAITLIICSAAYEFFIRIAPWMVGKTRKA